MGGEVNEAIFAERGVIHHIEIGGEIADNPAVAGERSDLPRLPVGRREAVQVWQGARIDVGDRFRRSFPSFGPHRTLTRSPADAVIGAGEDRVREDNDTTFGGLSHGRLPVDRRQRRGRGHNNNFVIGDQRSVGDGGRGRGGDVERGGGGEEGRGGGGDGGRERGGKIRTRILSVSRSPCPFVPSSPRLPASPPLHLRRGQRGKGDELQCALRGDEQ